MAAPTKLAKRQENLGPAGFFEPQATNPASNQIVVKAGYAHVGGVGVVVQTADQNTAGFAVVAPGNQRYDLVYIDRTGAAGIQQGTAVATGTPAFRGAPGWTGTTPGPAILDNVIPVAWVFVDETGSVVVADADITQINGFLSVERDFSGYFVDFGLVGSVPAGSSSDVSALFASETHGGSSSQAGVITTATLNVVHVTDEHGDEIKHTATGEPVYGRLTWAGGVWTLTYYRLVAGAETAVANMQTDTTGGDGAAPTDIRLAFTPKVFSKNDPNRPLFASALVPMVGKVVGEIPLATTADAGVVVLATPSADVTAGHVVQASDARVGTITASKNGGAATGRRPNINVIEGGGVTITVAENGGTNSLDITIASTGTFPGFASATSPDTNGGSGGGSGLAAQSDHAHAHTTIYRHTAGSSGVSGNPLPSTSVTGLGIALLAIACVSGADGTNGGISVGFYSGSGQSSVNLDGNGNNNFNGVLAQVQNGNSWTGSNIGTNTVNATTGGTNRVSQGVLAAIGSPF